jgi:hypothetical protein
MAWAVGRHDEVESIPRTQVPPAINRALGAFLAHTFGMDSKYTNPIAMTDPAFEP